MDELTLQTRIAALLEQGAIKVPGLPDIALRVRRATEDDNLEISELARLIQADIPLVGRLIQVVNSPLYRGEQEIEHLQAAITRLGLKVTRSLVLSFSLRRNFTSKRPQLDRLAKESWKHSVKVAAIAFVLARVTPRLDPEQALLAGLVHNIGVLPILAYAERDLRLLQNDALLRKLVRRAQPRLGVLVLRQWRFDASYIEALPEMNKYDRYQPGPAEVADVVIAARLLADLRVADSRALQELEAKAVVSKFPVFRLGAGAALELLAEAKEEMMELTGLLTRE